MINTVMLTFWQKGQSLSQELILILQHKNGGTSAEINGNIGRYVQSEGYKLFISKIAFQNVFILLGIHNDYAVR